MINQDTTKYPLLKDDVAKKILKNKKIGKEYMARIVSNILEEDYYNVPIGVDTLEEGILKNQREMIVEMNSHGVSVDVIAMCTHLSIEEVLTIIKNSEI